LYVKFSPFSLRGVCHSQNVFPWKNWIRDDTKLRFLNCLIISYPETIFFQKYLIFSRSIIVVSDLKDYFFRGASFFPDTFILTKKGLYVHVAVRPSLNLNPEQPKVLVVKFSLKETERIFPLKYEILSFGRCLNIKFQVSRGVINFKLWQYETKNIL